MKAVYTRFRRKIGMMCFVLALVFIAWLPLGVLEFVPFLLQLPGESGVRSHAGAAVACLLGAAWGFWES